MLNDATEMTTLNVSVPSKIFLVLRENETYLTSYMKRYAALNLFQRHKLSIGQCAELADMTEEDFMFFLGENKVSIFDYLDETELKKELENV